LRAIRAMLYELLTKGITADLIFQNLVREFLKPANQSKGAVHENIKPAVMSYAVLFEGRCIERAKAIIHLEAFLARVMALIR
jgi:replication factor C subunit 3/5